MKTRLLSQETAEELHVGDTVSTGEGKLVAIVSHYYKPPPSSGRVVVREIGEARTDEYYPSVIDAKIVLVDENKLDAKQIAKIATYCEGVCQLFPSEPQPEIDGAITDSEEFVMEDWEKMLAKLIDGDTELPLYADEKVGYWVGVFTDHFEQYRV